MANITVRNIPDNLLEKIRTLSLVERRSLNNEILMVLEKGMNREMASLIKNSYNISKDIQLKIWKRLSEKWEDKRETRDIVEDIYSKRTLARRINVEL